MQLIYQIKLGGISNELTGEMIELAHALMARRWSRRSRHGAAPEIPLILRRMLPYTRSLTLPRVLQGNVCATLAASPHFRCPAFSTSKGISCIFQNFHESSLAISIPLWSQCPV